MMKYGIPPKANGEGPMSSDIRVGRRPARRPSQSGEFSSQRMGTMPAHGRLAALWSAQRHIPSQLPPRHNSFSTVIGRSRMRFLFEFTNEDVASAGIPAFVGTRYSE